MRILNDTIFTGALVVADVAGETINLDYIYGLTIQLSWISATAAGTIKVQASNDENTWIDLTTHNQTVNNDSQDKMIEINNAYYKYIRVYVDWTSGSITAINAIINGKGI